MPGILVFAEQRDHKIKKPTLEAVALARKLAGSSGGDVSVMLAGEKPAELVADLQRQGADVVLTVADARLALYAPEAYARALEQAIRSADPDLVLLAATAMGKDLAPRVAARLRAGLASDCTHVEKSGDGWRFRRPVYSGKAIATVAITGSRPAMATLRPNVFALPASPVAGRGEARALAVDLQEKDFRCRTVSIHVDQGAEVDVAEASIVVSGGRAMKGPENFSYIRDLAKALGGAVGASRAAVDAGWIDHQHQVGQTGKVVSPSLYVACGISGAIQHLAGMSSSKVIVVINKDADAPLFKIADYGIVGDLYQVIPMMVQEVNKLKS